MKGAESDSQHGVLDKLLQRLLVNHQVTAIEACLGSRPSRTRYNLWGQM